jgi:hypothetical protein
MGVRALESWPRKGFPSRKTFASDLLAQRASLLEHQDRVTLFRAARGEATLSAFVPDQTVLSAHAI